MAEHIREGERDEKEQKQAGALDSTGDNTLMTEQRGEVTCEKDQEVGNGGKTADISTADMIKQIEDASRKTVERPNRFKDWLCAICCCHKFKEWVCAMCCCQLPDDFCSGVPEYHEHGIGHEHEHEFGREVNKNNYFSVAALDIHTDFSGRGGGVAGGGSGDGGSKNLMVGGQGDSSPPRGKNKCCC